MRIKVKINGHQHYSVVEGDVLLWCTGVEHYTRDGKTQAMQVPAVIVQSGSGVEVVTLQRDLYWTEVELL